MHKLFLACGVICALLATSCATERVLPESSISLSKSKCLGSCPAYSMELYSDGTFVWNGRAHVSVIGTRKGHSMISAYREASQLIAEANIDDFRDQYEAGADCATLTTDQQMVVIGVRNGSTVKTIRHYLGCKGFAKEIDLLRLEIRLEQAMRIREFVR